MIITQKIPFLHAPVRPSVCVCTLFAKRRIISVNLFKFVAVVARFFFWAIGSLVNYCR